MGGRYLVTGAQLGMLKALSKTDIVNCHKLIDEIIEKQHVYDSNEDILTDVENESG